MDRHFLLGHTDKVPDDITAIGEAGVDSEMNIIPEPQQVAAWPEVENEGVAAAEVVTWSHHTSSAV
jgi:hypothetical protein